MPGTAGAFTATGTLPLVPGSVTATSGDTGAAFTGGTKGIEGDAECPKCGLYGEGLNDIS